MRRNVLLFKAGKKEIHEKSVKSSPYTTPAPQTSERDGNYTQQYFNANQEYSKYVNQSEDDLKFDNLANQIQGKTQRLLPPQRSTTQNTRNNGRKLVIINNSGANEQQQIKSSTQPISKVQQQDSQFSGNQVGSYRIATPFQSKNKIDYINSQEESDHFMLSGSQKMRHSAALSPMSRSGKRRNISQFEQPSSKLNQNQAIQFFSQNQKLASLSIASLANPMDDNLLQNSVQNDKVPDRVTNKFDEKGRFISSKQKKFVSAETQTNTGTDALKYLKMKKDQEHYIRQQEKLKEQLAQQESMQQAAFQQVQEVQYKLNDCQRDRQAEKARTDLIEKLEAESAGKIMQQQRIIDMLNKTVETQEAEITQMKKLQEGDSEVDLLKRQLEQHKSETDKKIQQLLSDKNALIQEYEEKLSVKDDEFKMFEKLQEQLNINTKETKDELQQKITELQTKLVHSTEQNVNLQQKLDLESLKPKKKTVKFIPQSLVTPNLKDLTLEQQVDSLKSQNDSFLNQLKLKQQELDELRNKFEFLEEQNAGMRVDFEQANEKLDGVNAKRYQEKQQIMQREESCKLIEAKLSLIDSPQTDLKALEGVKEDSDKEVDASDKSTPEKDDNSDSEKSKSDSDKSD